jgi:two-component system cell cycle response regulator
MKVLVADDSATIRALLESSLCTWGFEVVEAKDGEQAWAALEAPDAPNLAILDWEMPGLDGIELCRRLREREAKGKPYTYVLLGSGHGDKQAVIAGMEAGADDYVVKPFDEQELCVRLRAGKRIVELQAELYRMQELLQAQSRTDSLTGCFNRRGIFERCYGEMSLARRLGRSLGVGLLDIDQLKHVNQAHGQEAGDLVLLELVRRVSATIRASDAIGRTGGEEFLLLWPGLSPESVRLAAERICVAVKESPFVVGEASLAVTASIGLTTTLGTEGLDVVLARAKHALRAAGESGQHRLTVL